MADAGLSGCNGAPVPDLETGVVHDASQVDTDVASFIDEGGLIRGHLWARNEGEVIRHGEHS